MNFLHGLKDYTLYCEDLNADDLHEKYFSTDPEQVWQMLSSYVPKGDEDMLLALDIASDLLFDSLRTTKRVIALFSDERLETGVDEGARISKLPALHEKLMARHIQLFAAIPQSPNPTCWQKPTAQRLTTFQVAIDSAVSVLANSSVGWARASAAQSCNPLQSQATNVHCSVRINGWPIQS